MEQKYLKKEDTIFHRDGQGNLLPVDVKLESIEGEPFVSVIPLTKGELQELFAVGTDTKQQDEILVLKNCVNPRYTEEEIKSLKPKLSAAIAMAIMAISLDIPMSDLLKEAEKKTGAQTAALLFQKKKDNSN